MKITLEYFRWHKHLELEFEDNKVTLIKGISGVGKSTIFIAIRWCLYGDLKKIYPKDEEKNKKIIPSVTIEYRNIRIKRSKNPELLFFKIDDNEYKDDVAQGQINLMFGDFKIWYNCSYSEQEYRNLLITGTENEKIELLNTLSFSGTNPEETINKIIERIKLIKFQLVLLKEKQKISTNEYNTFLNEYNGKFNNSDALNEYDYNILKNKNEENKLILETYNIKKINNDQNIILKNHLLTEKNNLEQKLSELSISNLEKLNIELNDISKKILEYNIYLNEYPLYLISLSNIQKYEIELIELKVITSPEIIYNNIKEVTNNINNYNSKLGLCNNRYNVYTKILELYILLNSNSNIPNLENMSLELVKYKQLQEMHNQNNINLNNYNKLKSEIFSIETTIKSKPELNVIKNELDMLSSYLQYENIYNNNIKLGIKISELNLELEKLKYTKYINYNYTDEQCNQIEVNINEYNTNFEICVGIGINFNFETINNLINNLNKCIEILPLIEKKKKILKLQSDLTLYINFNTSDSDLLLAYEKLVNLKNSVDILICPSCNTNLRLSNGILGPAGSAKSNIIQINDSELEYKKLIDSKEKTKIKEKIINELNLLLPIPEVEIIDINLNDIYMKLQILKNIKIVNKPELDLETIKNYKKVKNIISELEG